MIIFRPESAVNEIKKEFSKMEHIKKIHTEKRNQTSISWGNKRIKDILIKKQKIV